jgi:antitoxin VapB
VLLEFLEHRRVGGGSPWLRRAPLAGDAAVVYNTDIDHGGAMAPTARVFWNGRSQAIRLPKEFRFEGSEVRIRREGNRVILEPLGGDDWGEAFWEVFGAFGEDFDVGDRSGRQIRELFD